MKAIFTGNDTLRQTDLYEKYDLLIDGKCCGGCCLHNRNIVALDFNLPNRWSVFYNKGNDYFFKMCKILISKPNMEWYNINPKMFDAKTRNEVKTSIDKLPEDTELWQNIKELCQKAYKYADDKNKFKEFADKQKLG